MRITLKSGALSFSDDSTRAMGIGYQGVIHAFNGRYDYPTGQEENSKILALLSLATSRGTESDNHAALKCLGERIQQLDHTAVLRHRDSEEKYLILFHTVSAEAWYLYADSKLPYPYDFAVVVEALRELVRSVQVHPSRLAYA